MRHETHARPHFYIHNERENFFKMHMHAATRITATYNKRTLTAATTTIGPQRLAATAQDEINNFPTER